MVKNNKQPKYNKQMEKRDGGGKRYKYAVNYKNQQSEHLTLKNGAKFFDMELKNPSSVQKFSTGRRQDLKHPTQKPLEMMKYFISTYSDENDCVLANKMPMKYHENVLVFYKKQPKYNKQMENRVS